MLRPHAVCTCFTLLGIIARVLTQVSLMCCASTEPCCKRHWQPRTGARGLMLSAATFLFGHHMLMSAACCLPLRSGARSATIESNPRSAREVAAQFARSRHRLIPLQLPQILRFSADTTLGAGMPRLGPRWSRSYNPHRCIRHSMATACSCGFRS